ncbi:MAG TPA: PepSY domain-containing protein [Longimicrobium sp.]|jgi:uncharacterized iron-regulated membrane protein
MSSATDESNRFYLAAWRWHFYAGLLVVPFLVVLAATGMVMLLSGPADAFSHREWLHVIPRGTALSPEEQLRRVRDAYPHGTVAMYLPPRAADRSAQVSIVPGHGGGAHAEHGAATLTVYVDPYTGAVLGARDPLRTPYAWAARVHGTLLLGTAGDLLIEVVAGFGVLLIATGLFLWWPRGDGGAVLWPRVRGRRRIGWRDLHAALGFWGSGVLAFFLLSGLAWTPVWGGKLVQGFSSLPPAQIQSPPANPTHASLNRGVLREVPWVLEQTPMPSSGSLAGLRGIPAGMPVRLNSVVAFARDNGFTGYRVNFPAGSAGVWTLAAATMSGDITDPRRDRMLHLDQYTGRVLADHRFATYPLLGKAMAAGIALHQGNAGILNLVANLLVCLGVIALCASGVAMWWLRRPAGVRRLAAPPLPRDVRVWRRAAVVMFTASLAFPLVALTLATVALIDLAVVSRVPALRAALK